MMAAPLVEVLPLVLREHPRDPVVTKLLADDLEFKIELDGYPVWIPADRNTNPIFGGELVSVEALFRRLGLVGTTGWRWRALLTIFLILDFDADNHDDGHTAEVLAQVIEAARKAGYVWVRHSKSGKGIHVIVPCQPLPAGTGAEHSHNCRAILSRLCEDAGFDFTKYLCSRQVGFFWTPGELPPNAFKVLVEPTCEPPVIDVAAFVPPEKVADEAVFTAQHEEDIKIMQSAGFIAAKNGGRLAAHSKGFEALVAATGRICTYSSTSPGHHPQTANLWAWPTDDGGWNITRFNVAVEKEAACWHVNAEGFASTHIPAPPDEEGLSRTAVPDAAAIAAMMGVTATPAAEPAEGTEAPPAGDPQTDPAVKLYEAIARSTAPPVAAPKKVEHPTITVGTDLYRVVSEGIDALSHDRNTYQRGVLVEVVHDAKKPARCLHDNGSPRLRPIPYPTLEVKLSHCARWEKWNEKAGENVACLPPKDVVAAIACSASYTRIPVVTGVLSCPVLRDDGSIRTTPGYDPETGLFLDIHGEYPALMPTEEAVAMLLDIVRDFPFKTPSHRSTFVAGTITLVARSAFAGAAPMFLIDANQSRVGKGLLLDVMTNISEGRNASRYSLPQDNDELRKRITSIAISGQPYLLFDNIVGKLGNAVLENAITASRWSDRLLGRNGDIDIPLMTTWLGTGNNISITHDMTERLCYGRLETPYENPAQRTGFKYPNLLAHVKEHRRELVTASISIPARYILAGRPAVKLAAWGGFEAWSDLVRGSLVWSGLADPGANREELASEADDENALLRQLMAGWTELGSTSTIAQACEVAYAGKSPIIRSVLDSLSGDPKHALGQLLKSVKGRVLGAKRFEKTEAKVPAWRLVEVQL
jgi:hypothetical protein